MTSPEPSAILHAFARILCRLLKSTDVLEIFWTRSASSPVAFPYLKVRGLQDLGLCNPSGTCHCRYQLKRVIKVAASR